MGKSGRELTKGLPLLQDGGRVKFSSFKTKGESSHLSNLSKKNDLGGPEESHRSQGLGGGGGGGGGGWVGVGGGGWCVGV